jgi:uncharacterized protein YndB with AHSA1/START domain
MAPRAYVSLVIDSPIERVWAAMIDMQRYPEWNPFVIRVDGVGDDPRAGQAMVLHVRWGDGKVIQSSEEISRIEPPSAHEDGVTRGLLEYAFRGPLHRLNLVRGSRVQRVERLDEARTRYESEEVFSGWMAWGVPLAQVQDGFERHARALAERVRR